MKYTELTFTELVNKIGNSRFFDLPKMLKEAFTRLANTPSYEPPYKVYTALLSQSGTDAPVATVLENTLGDIVWSYSDIGVYNINSNQLFTENKTFIISGSEYIFNPSLLSTTINSDSNITLSVRDVINDFYVDNNLVKTPIEIRVYS